MPLRSHQVLAFLIELKHDEERAHVLNGGFDLLKAAHDAGLVEWSEPYTLDDLARAIDALRAENLVALRDPHAEYRAPRALFLGNELGNSRDIYVTQAGRAHHALLAGQRPLRAGRVSPTATSIPSSDDAVVDGDFFISYNRADRAWAEWIAWQLEEAGYSTLLQAWDFVPGSNFVVEMDRAAQQAKRTIAVLSPSYLAAAFTQPEWASAFAGDPTGVARKLVPVRVAECEPRGVLGQVVYLELVGLDEQEARDRLLSGVGERLKPSEPPAFPGAEHPGEPSPAFPGEGETALPARRAPSPRQRGVWVKIDDVIFSVDELDDAGETVTLKGCLDNEALRGLGALRQRGYGNPRVRFVSADRVAEADFSQLRRTTRGGATEATIELTRAQDARGDTLRAGTGGLSPDDLVEAGTGEYFLGEPLPASLGMLGRMADPGLNRDTLARAFALDDAVASDVVRLLLVEALVGNGHAQAVTRCEIGPRQGDTRQVAIEWLEPRVDFNVGPQRRSVVGIGALASSALGLVLRRARSSWSTARHTTQHPRYATSAGVVLVR